MVSVHRMQRPAMSGSLDLMKPWSVLMSVAPVTTKDYEKFLWSGAPPEAMLVYVIQLQLGLYRSEWPVLPKCAKAMSSTGWS